jgi:hypothetical protein
VGADGRREKVQVEIPHRCPEIILWKNACNLTQVRGSGQKGVSALKIPRELGNWACLFFILCTQKVILTFGEDLRLEGYFEIPQDSKMRATKWESVV